MTMKNLIYFAFVLVSFMFVACDPDMEDAPNLDAVPTAEDVSFTVAPGADDFTFVYTNTSTITGIAKWDFGNGAKGSGDVVEARYVVPGDYTVVLSLYASGGSATSEMVKTTTETDYSIFSDAKYINLSGGLDAVNGKTWVIDSLSNGHFGIHDPLSSIEKLSSWWWAASPLAKPNSGAYDDEFVFKIEGFDFGFNNNGDSYVKDFRKDLSFYSNPVELYGEPDCIVDYTPAAATWSISSKDDGDYIILTSATPAFFGFDYGAVDSEFRIEELTENSMALSCIGGDGNRWFYKLITKGYELPTVTYSLSVEAGTDPNAYVLTLADVVIPEGNFVTGYTVDFGDGSAVMEVEDYTASIEHTYMRKGAYNVSVVVMSSAGDFPTAQTVAVDAHHPDYVEFILDEMVMYSDFSEVELAPVLGENCAVNTVDNPTAIYPNRSSKVASYSKDGQEWANAFLKLPAGFRFDLRLQSAYKLKVYGKAGDVVLLKLENTDRGGNAWQTGVELTYTIQADNTWEVVEYDFAGVGAGFDWTGDIYTGDVATDDNFNHDFYNIIRIMLNPGVGEGVHEFYFDDLAGPHVEGVKSGRGN